jgi:hypothetical protein
MASTAGASAPAGNTTTTTPRGTAAAAGAPAGTTAAGAVIPPAPGGPPPPPPPPPPSLFPSSYSEYYTLRRDLDPPLDTVMDAFKSTPCNDPTVAVKTHDELNQDLIGSRDLTHHRYVMLSRTDRRLIVVHRLS